MIFSGFSIGAPSTMRGTRKHPSPRVPSGADSGRAVTANRSASATEQNHFSPVIRHAPGSVESDVATTFAPTSDPPWTSVRNCDPRSDPAKLAERRPPR